MTIVDELTPTQYHPIRFVVEVAPDTTLTVESLSVHTDVHILSVDDQQLGNDHPMPQATEAQMTAFLTWIQDNLSLYEAAVGLTRYTEA